MAISRGPQLIEHERAVLGAILLEAWVMEGVSARVTPDDFSVAAHRHIFSVMLQRFNKGETLDQLSIYRDLKQLRLKIEGIDLMALADLQIHCPATSTANAYAEQIRQAAKIRRVSHEARVVQQACSNGEITDVDSAISSIMEIWQSGEDNKAVTLNDACNAHVQYLIARQNGSVDKWSTGVPLFDEYANQGLGGGLRPQQLMICCGRAGAGKTTTALHIVGQLLKTNPELKAAFFSLELCAEALGGKMIRSEMPYVQGAKLPKGEELIKQSQGGAAKIKRGYGDRIQIIDHTGMSPTTILSMSRNLSREGVRVFVIDHLHRVSYPSLQDLRHQIGDLCKQFTDFAKDHDALFIVCAQLNRESERLQRSPTTSDIAESGQVEQHADIILAVHPKKDRRDIIYMTLLKNRFGPPVTKEFSVSYEYQRFQQLAQEAYHA